MFDFLFTKEQVKLRDEVRELVKWVPRSMILDMDADKIRFPKEFLKEAGKRNLLGCRYPEKWGGRDMNWEAACMVMEEVGVLGYIFACVFGVGAELVCDAIVLHGNDAQKEKYVKPLLKGDLFAAECLTEPRGGSDFFGTTTIAEGQGGPFSYQRPKEVYRGGRGRRLFSGVRPHRSRRQAAQGAHLLHRRPGAGRGDESTFTDSWGVEAAARGDWCSRT